MTHAESTSPVVLLTGLPTTFLAGRVMTQLLAEHRTLELRCIVQEKFLDRARGALRKLPAQHSQRVTLLEGDAAAMDLGLSGREYTELAQEITHIHHCATITYLGASRAIAERGNVDSAREVIELCECAPNLQRLVHWSSALISGERRGYVLEEECSNEAGFRNVIEETRFRAERLVREAGQKIPTTILRPSTIVGDSETGEIDRFDGPYLLVLLMLNSPVDIRLPMPGRGDIPLNLVPIDYVVNAGLAIAKDPRSIGMTFHIVDPEPHTAKGIFELVAKEAGRPLPRGFVPTNVATALLRTPGLERFAHIPRAFLEQLATEVIYDDRNTRELLAGSGITCPRFENYVATMVQYVRDQQTLRREQQAASPTEAAPAERQ